MKKIRLRKKELQRLRQLHKKLLYKNVFVSKKLQIAL